MEFGRPLTGHSLVTSQRNTTKLGKITNFHVIFLPIGFTSSYDAIWTMCKLGPGPLMNFGTGNTLSYKPDFKVASRLALDTVRCRQNPLLVYQRAATELIIVGSQHGLPRNAVFH